MLRATVSADWDSVFNQQRQRAHDPYCQWIGIIYTQINPRTETENYVSTKHRNTLWGKRSPSLTNAFSRKRTVCEWRATFSYELSDRYARMFFDGIKGLYSKNLNLQRPAVSFNLSKGALFGPPVMQRRFFCFRDGEAFEFFVEIFLKCTNEKKHCKYV